MKPKLYLILAGFLLLTVHLRAQAPNSLNYQGVARGATGAILPNQNISLRFTIHEGSASGTTDYQETQAQTTNEFGLFTVALGTGTIITGNFSTIAWGANAYYLQIEMDPTGGSNFIDMGTNQFLSVPYALYAASAGNSGSTYTGGKGINITGAVISAQSANPIWNGDKLQGDSVSITAPTPGQVLQWNGSAWEPTTPSVATSGWSLIGNTGTTAGTNYIGTTDANDLVFKTKGVENMRITNSNGYVGIGTSSPSAALHVLGVSGLSAFSPVAIISGTGQQTPIFMYADGTTFGGVLKADDGGNVVFTSGAGDLYLGTGADGVSNQGNYSAVTIKNGAPTNSIYVAPNGFVGLGTATPAQVLHAVDPNNSSSDFGGYNFQIEVEAPSGTNAGIYLNGSSGNNGLAGIVDRGFNTAFYTGLNNTSDFRIAGVAGIDAGDLTTAKDGTAGLTILESNGDVGVGTSSPAQALDIESGNIQFAQALMPNGDPGSSGEVLQSNGPNTAPTWVVSGSGGGGWALNGNAGTTYGTDFIGTTDDQGLLFEVNGTVAGRIEDNNNGNNSYGNTSLGFGDLQNVNGGSGGTGNSALGYNALANNTTGANNVAIGIYALVGNTIGNSNVAIGLFAIDGQNGTTTGSNNVVVGEGAQYSGSGNNNTSMGTNAGHGIVNSSSNVSVGYEALAGSMGNGNDPGSQNVAIGSYALYSNSSTGQNVALGDSALTDNSSGANNTALGFQTLAGNQIGGQNTAIGYEALQNNDNDFSGASQNTAIGYEALQNNTDGYNDLAVGYQAMQNSGNGNSQFHDNTAFGNLALQLGNGGNEYENTAVGYLALQNNTGNYNTAVGSNALVQLTSGMKNVAFGESQESNQTGSFNVSVGQDALYSNTSSNYNTGIGVQAATNTTGADNTAVGYNSLATNTGGANNTAIGYLADAGSNSLTNATVIGANAIVNASNAIQEGSTSVTLWNFSNSNGVIDLNNDNYYFGTTASGNGYGPAGNNDAGSGNIAMGLGALGSANSSTSNNIALGDFALSPMAGGEFNTIIGFYAGRYIGSGGTTSNVSGSTNLYTTLSFGNTSVGRGSAYSITSGSLNTAIGLFAMGGNYISNGNVTGNANTAVGFEALDAASGSSIVSNTAIGSTALLNNTGNKNVAVGDSAMASNSSGGNNTALGYQALQTNQTGNNITAVGYGADVAIDGLTNSIAIGSGATITMSNQLIIPVTVTHVNMAGIPAFADDAAAGTGGLVKGDMYQTDGTGAAPLNVAGILMIKQ